MTTELTVKQKQAIELLDGNVIVCAGAGTGKTTVLVERFLKIILEKRASCSQILAITFTDKAANEMKKRLVLAFQANHLIAARREIENSYIGTIHAFCSRVLKEHPIEAGIDPEFGVIHEEEANLLQEKALDQLIEERFSEEATSELLRGYSEQRIRNELKELYAKIRNYELPPEQLLSGKLVMDEPQLKRELLKALEAMSIVERKKEQAIQAIEFLSVPRDCDWNFIEDLEKISKNFDLRSEKDRVQSEQVKNSFQLFIDCQIEKMGISFGETFRSLLLDFAGRYEMLKKQRACFDFSDLQNKTIELLASSRPAGQAVRQHYLNQFKFIMVDEFQDVDPLQFRLISLLSSGKNVFVVGDHKQSIYGFRGADPEIFSDMIQKASLEGGAIISLTENFRSQKEVLYFVNQCFETLWKDREIKYEPLIASKTFAHSGECAIDWIEVEKDDDEAMDESRLEEAKRIAGRIRELVHDNQYEYKEIAMLFRSGTSMALYEQEFRNAQIPYYILGGQGFYERPEIRDILNVLRILENPTHDIPLAAVLRSPLFALSDESLFWISRNGKSSTKNESFYWRVLGYESILELQDSEKAKLKRFWDCYANWLKKKGRLSASDLIETILNDTHYDLYVLGLVEGKRHYANLRKLIDLAREADSKEALHLGDFIRLVEGYQANEARESEAQVQAEEGNVVRFLTIHKAKGLEFRCVIIPDLSRRTPPLRSAFVFDRDIGLGLKVYNPKTGELVVSPSFDRVQQKIKINSREESKRLLYVAMTRSCERLILAGTLAKKASKNALESDVWFDWLRQLVSEQHLPVNQITEDQNQPVSRAGRSRIEYAVIRKAIESFHDFKFNPDSDSQKSLIRQLEAPEVRQFDRIDLPVSAYHAFLRDSDHEEYRLIYELGAQSISVSEHKNEELAVDDMSSLISPSEFGTMLHSVFESLIYKSDLTESSLQETVHFFARHENESVRKNLLTAAIRFSKSEIFSEIRQANKIYSEIPFSLRLKYGIVYGALDLLFQNRSGEWIIIDYKTSDITHDQIVSKARDYQAQMELYALACFDVLQVAPKRAILYFTKPDSTFAFTFDTRSIQGLKQKYESIQRDLLEFRRQLLSVNS